MSELGDVLELLHGARERWTTVRSTIRAWRHHGRSMGAWTAWNESRNAAASIDFASADGPPQPETSEMLTRLWIDGDRVREEYRGDEHAHLGIRRGRLWWIYDDVNGAISNEDDPDHGSGVGEQFTHLLDPSGISGGMHLDVLGAAQVAAREGIRLRAVPRPTRDPHRDLHLTHGADEHALVVDAERGVLLRLASRFQGEDFYVVEMLDVGFDEQFADELFVFTPPPGERVRAAGARFMVREVTIEEAQRNASFTVWIPGSVGPGWNIRVHHVPGDDRPPMPEAVSIHYWRHDATHQFSISETATGEADEWGGRWERVERGGEELLVASEPQARIRLERDGTQITIHSQDLALERLLELADTLVAAPTEPPPLAG